MEECYARLLKTRGETDESQRKAQLDQLVADYEEIARAFPDSALPHYRQSIALSALNRSTDAFEAAKRAYERLYHDPFTNVDAWVRSTIRRRLANFFGEEAHNLLAKIQNESSNTGLRSKYQSIVKEAFLIIYKGFRDETQHGAYLVRL